MCLSVCVLSLCVPITQDIHIQVPQFLRSLFLDEIIKQRPFERIPCVGIACASIYFPAAFV